LVAGLLLTLPEPRFLSEVVAAQVALGLAFGLYAWVAVRRQSEILAAVAVGQVTLLAAWLTLDYLPAVAAPFVAFGLALALLWAAPRAPGRSLRWLEPLALAYALAAPLAGILAEFLGAPAQPLLGLGVVSAGQLALLLTTVLFVARGWLLRRRLLTTTGAFLLYLLSAWIAAERGATAIQLYTLPLGVLVFALAWLFPESRHEWELGAATIVLLPAGLQSLAYADLLYSILLGAWGLALLVVGVSLSRRIPITAGASGLLVAALRQLWNIVATLPTWAIIGIVGLALMALAVLLLLRRDRLLRIGELGAGYWARLGEVESRQEISSTRLEGNSGN
ncbi:MAG TPA: hypothetical protein VER55_08065, partial [Ardenticatenaceae bacterium]|nr:hypothetical protein [Ardenticatenaceae bacterium]